MHGLLHVYLCKFAWVVSGCTTIGTSDYRSLELACLQKGVGQYEPAFMTSVHVLLCDFPL
jgi:hypothetical protein